MSPRHTRNVEKNPAVTLTLESGTEVVIIEGESHATRAEPDDLGVRLTQAFGKYADAGYAPEPDAWVGQDGGGLRIITPRRAMAWFDFPPTAPASRSEPEQVWPYGQTLSHWSATPLRRTEGEGAPCPPPAAGPPWQC